MQVENRWVGNKGSSWKREFFKEIILQIYIMM